MYNYESNISFVEWLNENTYRRYPFKDDSQIIIDPYPGVSTDSLLLDMAISTDLRNPVARLTHIIGYDDYVNFIFEISGQRTHYDVHLPVVIQTSVPRDAEFPYRAFPATENPMVAENTNTFATSVFGESVAKMHNGTYNVAYAYLSPTCVMSHANTRVDALHGTTVRHDGIIVHSGAGSVSGDVTMVPGPNCNVTVTGYGNADNNGKLTITPWPQYMGGACHAFSFDDNDIQPAILSSINGVTADANGNINIHGGAGVTVTNDKAAATIHITLDELSAGAACENKGT